jgi:uncharacterized membrane protein YjjB (DUF3815 family)
MDLLTSLEKLLWCASASFGFAILFNVPSRTLPLIFVMGAVCGGVRLIGIELGGQAILGSFMGAAVAGFISVWAAHTKHSPPLVFAIPAVIPMVPGAFAYRMMLGVMKLAGEVDHATYSLLVNETINNGLKTLFVLMALALGVSVPMLITRKETVKDIKLPRYRD